MSFWVVVSVVALSGLALLAIIERFGLPGSIMWRAARMRERRRAWLRARDAAQLLEQVRAGIAFGGFEELPSARGLLALGIAPTDRQLADGLTALLADCSLADRAEGIGGGPGSRVYDFYDGGLALILEVVSERG